MIHFNELKYDCNGTILVIDVSVDDMEWFDNVEISNIVIDTQDTYTANGPSSNPIFIYETTPDPYFKDLAAKSNNLVLANSNSSYVYIKGNNKNVRLEIPISKLNIIPSNTILFVYAMASGVPAPNTPCGMDRSTIMGTVIYLQDIYNRIISNIKEIEKECSIPKSFINEILKFSAIECCVRTGNYPLLIKYWKKFYENKLSDKTTKICLCNDRFL